MAFFDTAGFNVESGDIQFLRSAVVTITNPATEDGSIVDQLHADSSFLPTNWEIVGNSGAELTLQSKFPISFATADDVKQLLLNVDFISTALRHHEPRLISIVVSDLLRSSNPVYVTINVDPLNEPPVVSVVSAQAVFNEGGGPVGVYSDVNITDEDDITLEGVTVVLTLNDTTVGH